MLIEDRRLFCGLGIGNLDIRGLNHNILLFQSRYRCKCVESQLDYQITNRRTAALIGAYLSDSQKPDISAISSQSQNRNRCEQLG
jgi:hypothetical protein